MGQKAKTRAPASRAIRATSGVAPPPVPPPSPASKKTMSIPSSFWARASFSCSIALRAMENSPPVPIPRVRVRPMGILRSAMESPSARASTSITKCSTPLKLSSLKPSTRERPAPPTPIILARTAGFSLAGENSGF